MPPAAIARAGWTGEIAVLGGVFLSAAISARFVLGLGCVGLGLRLAHRRPEPSGGT